MAQNVCGLKIKQHIYIFWVLRVLRQTTSQEGFRNNLSSIFFLRYAIFFIKLLFTWWSVAPSKKNVVSLILNNSDHNKYITSLLWSYFRLRLQGLQLFTPQILASIPYMTHHQRVYDEPTRPQRKPFGRIPTVFVRTPLLTQRRVTMTTISPQFRAQITHTFSFVHIRLAECSSDSLWTYISMLIN